MQPLHFPHFALSCASNLWQMQHWYVNDLRGCCLEAEPTPLGEDEAVVGMIATLAFLGAAFVSADCFDLSRDTGLVEGDDGSGLPLALITIGDALRAAAPDDGSVAVASRASLGEDLRALLESWLVSLASLRFFEPVATVATDVAFERLVLAEIVDTCEVVVLTTLNRRRRCCCCSRTCAFSAGGGGDVLSVTGFSGWRSTLAKSNAAGMGSSEGSKMVLAFWNRGNQKQLSSAGGLEVIECSPRCYI